MQFKQTIQRDKQSICPKCIHSGLCRAEGNQPCASCNRFVPLEVRPISSEIREMLRFLAEDTTCPLHIAAQIDQILDMDSDKEIFIKWTSVTLRLPNEESEAAKAENDEQNLYPCLVVKAAPQAPEKRFVTKAWYDGKGFIDADCIRITNTVTHWSPMPNMPPLKGG